ncbi:MAG: flagellar export protein FliJ [Gammaproteobacteria bacterium]|jgi:flagellar export protein FliJ
MDTVVRIRGLQERIARADVARDQVLIAERRRYESAAVSAVDDASNSTPTGAAKFVAHRRMLDGGMRDISLAAAAVVVAHNALTSSLASWSIAAQRLEGVERLQERATDSAEAELEHSERAELDDIVIMQWDRD